MAAKLVARILSCARCTRAPHARSASQARNLSVTRPHRSTRRPIIECVMSGTNNIFSLCHLLIVILNRRVVSAFLIYRIVFIAWCRFEIAFPYRTRGHAACHSSRRFVVALFELASRMGVYVFAEVGQAGTLAFSKPHSGSVVESARGAGARRAPCRTHAVVLSVSVEAIRVPWQYSLRQ